MYPKTYIVLGCILLSVFICALFSYIFCESGVHCETPQGQKGFCMNFDSCKAYHKACGNVSYLEALEVDQLQHLNYCEGNASGKVCCPFEDGYDDAMYRESPPSIADHKNLHLLPSSCGYPNKSGLYAHEGYRAGLLEFPWMALIAYDDKNSNSRNFTCSGTIINNRYILTAAHCITNLGRRVLAEVRVGEHDYSKERDCETSSQATYCNPHVQNISIEKIIPHPGYIGIKDGEILQFQNDIGLLKLQKPIDLYAANANPVCLPTSRDLQEVSLDDETLVLPGWGHFIEDASLGGLSNTELLKINVSVVSNNKCGILYNRSLADGVGFRQLCAGGERGIGCCTGDAGAPLLLSADFGDSGQYVQLGIVSAWHQRCGTKDAPSLYTRVAYYMDWILDQLEP